MASSVIRQNFRRSAGIFISKMIRFANSCSGCKLGGPRMMMSTISSDKSPPWLMLPSDDDMAYKFYSLAEKKLLGIEKNGRGGEESPDDDAEVVGSSHGWLALFNRRNNDLFLSDPLSGRHIRLPRMDILPDPEMNLRNGRGSISKVILSTSPDDKGCRAVMTYGPGNKLAFCLPKRSWRWTGIGDKFYCMWVSPYHPNHAGEYAIVYEDLVYCKRRKLLSCMTASCEFDLASFDYRDSVMVPSKIENWDVESPLMEDWNMGSPQLEDWDAGMPSMEVWNVRKLLNLRRRNRSSSRSSSWVEENMSLLQEQCIQMPHLVYAEQLNRLYLVMRFVVLVGPDDTPLDRVPHCPIRGLRGCYPCKTVGFIVLEVDHTGYFEVVDDLNGLAIFVGINHSSAISVVSEFPQLKPNSIYFTGVTGIKMLDGRHDTGVFDYENKIMSPIIINGANLVAGPSYIHSHGEVIIHR